MLARPGLPGALRSAAVRTIDLQRTLPRFAWRELDGRRFAVRHAPAEQDCLERARVGIEKISLAGVQPAVEELNGLPAAPADLGLPVADLGQYRGLGARCASVALSGEVWLARQRACAERNAIRSICRTGE